MASTTERRKRFERGTPAHSLTPLKLEALKLVAESRFLSTPQVARIMGLSEHAARGHLRDLYDMGFTDVEAVPGIVVGSKALIAAKVHYPTKEGHALAGTKPSRSGYSPKQYAFLGHELAVRDTLAWLCSTARENEGHSVNMWDCSGSLQALSVRPDAVFHYALAKGRIAGIVEADMGSERGTSGGRSDRWAQKAEAYCELYGSEAALKGFVGTANVRIVVTVPDEARAEWIARRFAGSGLERKVWLGIRPCFAEWRKADGAREPFFPQEENHG